MQNKIKKVNSRGSEIWATMESGLRLKIKDYQGREIPFEIDKLKGKTLPEAFELMKVEEKK